MGPNPTFGELASVTINNMSTSVADNVSNNNALLMAIKKSGNISPSAYDPIDGGLAINETIEFASNPNTQSISGYDTFGTSAADVLTTASYPLKQYVTTVLFNNLEELQNAGKEKKIDIVISRVDNGMHSLVNLINQDLYLDGTGNAGKAITGLGAAVPLSPTNTYGGIDRSSYTFWKNKKFQASVDGSGVATSSTIQGQWVLFHDTLVRATDKPTVILAGPSVHSIFQGSLTAIQRVTSSDTANAGFTSVQFMGIPVILETTDSGIATTDAYFLNTKYLKWRPHKDQNFVTLDDVRPMNQLATARSIVFAGNLTCSGSKFQGKYSNT